MTDTKPNEALKKAAKAHKTLIKKSDAEYGEHKKVGEMVV